jgi:hypothetical protein
VDAILGYHTNPLTCGVAKFNLALTTRLGVPVVRPLGPDAARVRRPLLSIKVSELRDEDHAAFPRMVATAPWRDAFSLFLHDWTDTEIERALLGRATVAVCGNAEIAERVRALRSAVEAWCPSTVLEPRRFPSTATFFAAFFDRGVRANNTTVSAAMSCGAVVITNRDAYLPAAYAHLQTVIDIARCDALPTDPGVIRDIGRRAAAVATGSLGWDALVDHLARLAPAELKRE